MHERGSDFHPHEACCAFWEAERVAPCIWAPRWGRSHRHGALGRQGAGSSGAVEQGTRLHFAAGRGQGKICICSYYDKAS
eukprot:COSAG06_NODE_6096_length_3113_cov_2.928003_2_plen_80_part_00